MTQMISLLGLLLVVDGRAAEQKDFRGASAPANTHTAGPLSPAEEQALFTLPPGFEIELVASESEGIGKFITVYWDQRGRMWSMTALEYPVDANESPEAANALYQSIARDKVLVWDTPFAPGPHEPRIFADGLAIPLGILPYGNGVYVQHGPDILFLDDTDADGKPDRKETVLSGFGVQDSHLFPHQFTRAPGNWIWMAQGAFNYGKVRTASGAEVQFDQTRMARFRPDGSEFVITSQGPCNIWGLVLTAEGEAFIQEANDYGYPMMPFHEFANYPGCSDGQFKSYAPEFPGTAPHFRMGGTGLSGLALSDARGAWPEPYAGIFYVANPITRKIQAIKLHREGTQQRLEKLPDFLLSADEMFRPVAIAFGPDGCLYIVDWYNKIISHNEVPRTHPERDKKRGRIWRVKHKDQKPFPVPDFTRMAGEELAEKLGGDSIAQHHLAWQAIVDRKLAGLAPDLKRIALDEENSPARRIGALWALEGLRNVELEWLLPLLDDESHHVRREAVRALRDSGVSPLELVAALEPLVNDPEPTVRAEVIRASGSLAATTPEAVALCLKFARPALEEPTGRSTHSGRTIKVGAAYDREFERYLVRLFLEAVPGATESFLDSAGAADLPVENRLLGVLSLPPERSASRLAKLLPHTGRAPNREELLRMATRAGDPEIGEQMARILQNPVTRHGALEQVLAVRTQFDPKPLRPVLGEAAHALWHGSQPDQELALRLIAGFTLEGMESELAEALRGTSELEHQLAVLKALREIRSSQSALFAELARNAPNRSIREEALAALALSPAPDSPGLLLALWPELNHLERRASLDRLAGTPAGARAIVDALQSKALLQREIDAALFQKLQVHLPGHAGLREIQSELEILWRPVLRLNGKADAWLETRIDLEGPFTVETWVKLDPGIDNSDGILGAPGVIDMNFHDGRFRVWVGGHHDVVIAGKKIVPGSWTHVAVTRDESGLFAVYLNGELDGTGGMSVTNSFNNLRIGWTAPARGTLGWLTEFRVWNYARAASEIRAEFDRTFEEAKPPGLVRYFSGKEWPGMHPSAEVLRTDDFPALISAGEARALREKIGRFAKLAANDGSAERGRSIFANACAVCHTIGGEGGRIGPVLDGAGAMGTEALLRAVITPNAAMEAGYRTFRVELTDGELIDGMLVAQDGEAILMRQPNAEDQRIGQEKVRRAGFLKTSLMPEGLLESLGPEEVSDLFAYLKKLK